MPSDELGLAGPLLLCQDDEIWVCTTGPYANPWGSHLYTVNWYIIMWFQKTNLSILEFQRPLLFPWKCKLIFFTRFSTALPLNEALVTEVWFVISWHLYFKFLTCASLLSTNLDTSQLALNGLCYLNHVSLLIDVLLMYFVFSFIPQCLQKLKIIVDDKHQFLYHFTLLLWQMIQKITNSSSITTSVLTPRWWAWSCWQEAFSEQVLNIHTEIKENKINIWNFFIIPNKIHI